MKKSRVSIGFISVVLILAAGACSSTENQTTSQIVVNSLEDTASPPVGTVTLRSAVAAAGRGTRITFDPALDGATFVLTVVGDSHSVLLGEVYSGMTFAGYSERDYGKSALYARKDLTIDASSPPERHHDPVGRGRRQPCPGPGRVRRPDHEERDRLLRLFPGRGDHGREPALHPGPGRRSGGLGRADPRELRGHREHLLRRLYGQPRPGHLRRRHLRQRARPQGVGHQRQRGHRVRGGGRRHLLGRRRRADERPGGRRLALPGARSAATWSWPSTPTAAASSPCPAARRTWPRCS